MVTRNKTRSGPPENGSPRNVTPLHKVESLVRLRDRVEAAANEIVRLRTENRELAGSIVELRQRIKAESGRPTISFEEDAEVLRKKVRSFIGAIDTFLDREAGKS